MKCFGEGSTMKGLLWAGGMGGLAHDSGPRRQGRPFYYNPKSSD